MKDKMDNSECYPILWLTECGIPTYINTTNVHSKVDLENKQDRHVDHIQSRNLNRIRILPFTKDWLGDVLKIAENEKRCYGQLHVKYTVNYK